ncbi:MAG: Rv3235 family protein [Motilibacteraceae bacterium]
MSPSSAAALQDADAPRPAGAEGPRLRRIPTPQCEPPYEREVAQLPTAGGLRPAADEGAAAPRQGTLALAFALPGGLPARPAPLGPRPTLRLVTSAAPSGGTGDDEEDEEFVATPRCDLPDPTGWARRLTQAVLEVLAGNRPAAQLVRWTSAEVLAGVTARVGALAHGAPGGSAAASGRRPTVRSVRVSEVCDGVAEVSAVVVRNGRAGALALRLEGRDGRWQCTAFEAG